MEVHRELGSGFLEAVYQKALAHELRIRKILFDEQVHLPIMYKGELIGDYIADFIVDGKLIVEIKAVQDSVQPTRHKPCTIWQQPAFASPFC